MEQDLETKLKEVLDIKKIKKDKYVMGCYLGKKDGHKLYRATPKLVVCIPDDDELEGGIDVKKVEIVSNKPKRKQSQGNKDWWAFVKEISARPDMADKSRVYIMQYAGSIYKKNPVDNVH